MQFEDSEKRSIWMLDEHVKLIVQKDETNHQWRTRMEASYPKAFFHAYVQNGRTIHEQAVGEDGKVLGSWNASRS